MPSPSPSAESPVAVVLNKRAKSVKEPIQRLIREIHPPEHVYLSESREHGRAIAKDIVDKGYRTVATGGGDGTFVTCVSDIYEYLGDRPDAEPPRFFVLKLGTGNAVAASFGASTPDRQGLQRDLYRARQAIYCRRLPVLSLDGKLSPFAGCGLDAYVLHDYFQSRDALMNTPLGRLATGSSGYAISVATRTFPRCLGGRLPAIKVTNVGATTFRVSNRGRKLEAIPNGAVLYQGPAMIASASTIPYTGLNMRLFPYARLRDDRFHLRISSVGTIRTLLALPEVWRGRYEDPGVRDFLADRVLVEAEEDLPVQIGGDLCGVRRRFEIALAPAAVEMAA